MDGYFSVSQYAELEGISVDTAWHRVLRNTVSYFRRPEDGKYFVYYQEYPIDAALLADNYISIEDYAKEHGIQKSTIQCRITRGLIKEPDIYKYTKYWGSQKQWYIRKDYIWKDAYEIRKQNGSFQKIGTFQRNLTLNARPSDDYIPLADWCKQHQIAYSSAIYSIKIGKLPYKKANRYWFVRKDEPVPETLMKRKNDYTSDDYIPAIEWCRYNKMDYSTIYQYMKKNKIPYKKLGCHWYIHKDEPIPDDYIRYTSNKSQQKQCI